MLKIYRNGANGEIIRGQGLSAFIHNSSYYETIIGVFEDGKIDCWGLVNFEEFKTKVAQGWVVTQGKRILSITRDFSTITRLYCCLLRTIFPPVALLSIL